ncbi:MAG: hypothetical protein Q4B73_06050 [Lachnospiraceae bacterium]|nr:hypothetical protein [Lachnospiraceae bacterium]
MKYLITLLCLMLPLTFLTGCTSAGKNETSGTVYEYKDPDQCPDYHVTKTVYGDHTLSIYLTYNYDDNNNLTVDWVRCYRDDFSLYSDTCKAVYRDGAVTIETPDIDAADITGVEIQLDYGVGLKLRYLNTEQFAGLSSELLLDVGVIDYGDEDSFYSDAEKQEKLDNETRANEKEREIFELLKGQWVSEDGTSTVEITEGDNGYDVHFTFPPGSDFDEDYTLTCETFTGWYDEDEDVYQIESPTGPETAPWFFKLKEQGTVLLPPFQTEPYIRP